MKTRLHRLILVLALVAGITALGIAPAWAQSPPVIEGQVTSGTPGGEVPGGLEVSLTIFEGDTPVQQLNTATDVTGAFTFVDIPIGSELRYLVSVEYQGVLYQAEAVPDQAEPLALVVYESTAEQKILTVLDDTIMLTPGESEFDELLVREVVRVQNSERLTFVPSFGQESITEMAFLRISLPIGYQDLTVRSDLLGGQVIPVDRGVGITAPIPPGIHAVVLTYTLPYEGTDLVFEPLFPFGAQLVRVLLRDDVGSVLGSDLEEMEPVTVGENNFKVYEVPDIPPGQRITLGFTDLPQAPWTQRAWDTIKSEWELSLVIPGLTAVFLLALLVYAWRLRLRKPEAIDPDSLVQNLRDQPSQLRALETLARLDEGFDQGTISEREYRAQREDLKRTLLRHALGDARGG